MKLMILMIIVVLATASAESSSRPSTCLTYNNKCSDNTECCSGCCTDNVCSEDSNACNNPIVTKRRRHTRRPSCRDLNPPCQYPTKCVLENVQCFTTPCYPIPTCV